VKQYDCSDPAEREKGIAAAVAAARRGDLVVMPTDTLYGLGCDAFKKHAVAALFRAKGRGRDMPLIVMVGSRRTFDGLAHRLPRSARALADAFWPGALTLIVEAAKSLQWDLGETHGTVAVRMPLHPVPLEVLREIGPMAVTSANKTGQPPAVTAGQAQEQLGYSARVYLDGGPCPASVPSTIVDVTGPVPQVVRAGALDIGKLREVVPELTAPAEAATAEA
jgi:tRNA threonylcarbamoyl adenosine modification protein (Sua5/YciO/YrdC/YwlC family)